MASDTADLGSGHRRARPSADCRLHARPTTRNAGRARAGSKSSRLEGRPGVSRDRSGHRRRAGPVGATAETWVNGRCRASAQLSAGLVDRLTAIARVLAAVGMRLESGDRVLVGSLTHVPAWPGDHVTAKIASLGCVDVRLA